MANASSFYLCFSLEMKKDKKDKIMLAATWSLAQIGTYSREAIRAFRTTGNASN